MMWANPHVSGYLQCLISNIAIPMTMLLSVICFRSTFSKAAIAGVMLIIMGLLAVGGNPSDQGSNFSPLWTGVFIFAQLPLSAACIYQEYAFKESLNMIHYIHYVTLLLAGDLVVAIPIDVSIGDARSFEGFVDHTRDALSCIANTGPPNCEGVGWALAAYIL